MRIIYIILIFLFYSTNSYSLILNGNEVEFSKKLSFPNNDDEAVYIIQFSSPLSKKEKNLFFQKGVEVIKYAGDLSYYFYAKNLVFSKLSFKAKGFSPFLPLYKISQNILKKDVKPYAVDERGNYILKIFFFKKLQIDDFEKLLGNLDVDILKFQKDKALISIAYKDIYDLAKIPVIWHIEEKTPPIKAFETFKTKREDTSLSPTTNLKAYELMGVSKLWKEPYNLDGEGIKIALVDWGVVRPTHQEFMQNGESRIKIRGNLKDLSFHATHIAGTIAAKGVNPDAHGGAPKALIYNYFAPEISYTRAIAKAYFDEKITLSHHAYLYQDPAYSGVYDQEASDIDKLVYSNPTLNVFMAGGNDRTNPKYPNWGMMRGPTNAKNVFTFGLSIEGGKTIKYYSNTGPVNDGRIKPDLCAAALGNGRLLSTSIESDTAYKYGGGTSSATARAMGSAALILQEYKRITKKEAIRHDILKALLINTASDAGREGPDFEFGFGNMQPLKAVEVLDTLKTNKPLIKTGEIKQGEIKKYYINLKQPSNIKVTINWIDPAGDPNNQQKTLVNDIDMWIEKDGKIYYPFSLDKDNPTKPAVANDFNRIDNTEQIVIKNASLGVYKLFVKGYEIISDKQKFAIVSNHFLDFKAENEEGGEVNGSLDNNGTQEVKIPTAPSKLNAFAIDDTRVKLTWKDNSDNESGFKIYRDGKLIHITDLDITSFTDSGLQEDREYVYAVSSFNAKGESLKATVRVRTKKSSLNNEDNNQVISKKILEDAQSATTRNWGIYDHIPWGYGKIQNVYDLQKASRVIKLSDSHFIDNTTNNENGIGFLINKRFNERNYKHIQFALKSDGYFVIFLSVKTVLRNNVYLTYEPEGFNKHHYNNKEGEYVWISLGDISDGRWHLIKRDLNEDLKRVYPNDSVVSFKLFLVRGDLLLDDIALFSTSKKESDSSLVFIKNCYRNILGREPDENGKRYWIGNLKRGKSASYVVKYFFKSPEFQSKNISDKEFVRKAYKTILGREPDSKGEEYWLNELKSGKTRDLILYKFIFSKEFASFCDKCNVTNYLIEDRVEDFIARMYALVLGRRFDPKGMKEWKSMLLNGQKGATSLVKGFFNSKEFLEKNLSNREFVKRAYLAILGREADNKGLNYWLSLLNSKKISKEDLLNEFLSSDEFKTLTQKYQIEL